MQATTPAELDETKVRIRCARGHAERLIAVFTGAPGIYWHRADTRTPDAEYRGNAEFGRPSGLNGRHRLLCSCGLDERVSREGMQRVLNEARTGRITIR